MIPEHRPTRLPVFLASTFSKLYTIGINHRNRQYDRGVGVTTLDLPVISIGNLSTGGTGKTPLVQHLVRTLLESGHHPVIAMRGYKAKPGEPSDEQREHMEAFPGIPIVAQPDRIAGLRALLDTEAGSPIDCVVLDDGFQHRKLARDLDIVVIDASRPPTNDALLPLGFLRELPLALSRAQCVVISHAQRVEQSELGDLRRWIETVNPDAHIVVTEHQWSGLTIHQRGSGEAHNEPIESLDGRRIAVLSAIGHPDAFVDMATNAGAQIVHRQDRPDHDAYPDSVLARFVERASGAGAEGILTTQKDWTKLESRSVGGHPVIQIPVLVPQLGLRFRAGEEGLIAHCLRVFQG